MKNIVLSAVAVLAMSSFAVAGGDITPVEEPVVVVEEAVSTGAFYLGAAYGLLGTDSFSVGPNGGFDNVHGDEDFSQFMLQAGYKFNEYVAVEGRYWIGMDDNSWDNLVHAGTDTVELDTWGIYVKPMYPVTESFDVYALLGYASSDISVDSQNVTASIDAFDGFSWGVGAAYSFTENISLFVDYVALHNDEVYVNPIHNNGVDSEDFVIESWNFGVTYQF